MNHRPILVVSSAVALLVSAAVIRQVLKENTLRLRLGYSILPKPNASPHAVPTEVSAVVAIGTADE